MKTLKKNNISQGSSINSPVPVNKNCDLPPFFNTDYFSHVVVQTLEELESIPCKLRQDGMVATVVQDSYSDYQLQTSRTGFGICDNNAWVKISIGDEVFNGGNLFLFQTEEQANEFMGSTQSKEGQIIYISDLDSYFKFDGQDGLTDAFPNKLDKPTVQGLDNPNYKIPAYLDGKPYWRSSSDFEKVKSVNSKTGDVVLKTSDLQNDSDYTTNALLNKKLNKPTTNNTNQFVILGDGSTAPKNDFGKVDTVNKIEPDSNKNVNLGIDDILPKGMPLEETLDDNKKVLLYDDTGKSYWKSLSEVGKVKTVDNIDPDEQGNITTKYQELKESLDNEIVERARVDNLKLDKPTTTGSTISHPNVVGVDSQGNSAKLPAGDLGKNFANTDLTVSVNRKHTGTVSVELAMPMIYSNPSQRFSGLVDKSADATYNRLLGMNSQGNLNEVGIYALTNEMSKATDAQKDAWRVASRKSGEIYSIGQPRVDSIAPFVFLNDSGMHSLTLIGENLFINNVDLVSRVDIIDSRTNAIVETCESIAVHQTLPSRLSIDITKNLYDIDVPYYAKVTHNGIQSIINTNAYFIIKETYVQTTDTLNWRLITPDGQDNSGITFSSNNPNNFSVTKTRDEKLNIVSDYEFDYNKNYYLNLNINTHFPNGEQFFNYFNHTYLTVIDSDRVKGLYQDYASNIILYGGVAGYRETASVFNPTVNVGNNKAHNVELYINKGICRIVNITEGINAVIILPVSSSGKYKLFLYSTIISTQSYATTTSAISVYVNSFSIQ